MKISNLRQMIREEINNAITELNPTTVKSAINKAKETGRFGQASRISNLDQNASARNAEKNKEKISNSIDSVLKNIYLGAVSKKDISNPFAFRFKNIGSGESNVDLVFDTISKNTKYRMYPCTFKYDIPKDKFIVNNNNSDADIYDVYILSRKTVKYLFTAIKMLNPNTKLTPKDFGPVAENAINNEETIQQIHDLEK